MKRYIRDDVTREQFEVSSPTNPGGESGHGVGQNESALAKPGPVGSRVVLMTPTDPRRLPESKKCSCGRTYSPAGWCALAFVYREIFTADEFGPASDVEYRNCVCGSTIGIELLPVPDVRVAMYVGDDEPPCADPDCDYCLDNKKRRAEEQEEEPYDHEAARQEMQWEIDNDR